MPMEAVIPGDVELCEECAKMGIQIIECIQKGKKKKKMYPTGRFFIIKDEALDNMVSDEKQREAIRKERKMYVDQEIADMLERCVNDQDEDGR